MSTQNNNNDNWSNRNWQDASKFGGGRGNLGFGNNNRQGGFFGNQGGFFGNQDNGDNNRNEGGGLFGGNNSGKLGGGWMQGKNSMLVIVVVLIIVIIYTFYTQVSMNATITKSTIERTKITSTFDSANDPCFIDDFRVVEDERALRNAAKDFHARTGVIPFVYFTESDDQTTPEELTQKADAFYKENFTDQDHFIVFFDGLQGTFYMGTSIGENAKTVLDAEAQQIFKDYLTKFYETRQTNNQSYMVNTLRYASERMMSTLPYSKSTMIFGIIVIAVLIAVIIISIMRKSRASAGTQKPVE